MAAPAVRASERRSDMTTMTDRQLVDTAWLEEHLADRDVRIIDCTVYLPNYFEESAGTKLEIVPGRADYDAGHIPGSVYVDLVDDLTDHENDRFAFPMPDAEQFASEQPMGEQPV